MTDTSDTTCEGKPCAPADATSPPEHLARAVTAVQQHAFAALLAGEMPRVADIAETASRDATGTAQAIAWLDAHGRLERDGDHLHGAHGLTHRITPHALTIAERTLQTWCAYDALAIPIAVGVSARAATTCPTCRKHLVVGIADGQLAPDPAPRLWLPAGPCDNVIADFCTHANLFCTAEHLHAWRTAAGDPPGRPLTLACVPALARATWADIAPATSDQPADTARARRP